MSQRVTNALSVLKAAAQADDLDALDTAVNDFSEAASDGRDPIDDENLSAALKALRNNRHFVHLRELAHALKLDGCSPELPTLT